VSAATAAWLVAVYALGSADVLLFEGFGWVQDALYAHHVRRCDEDHGDWSPRWAAGWKVGVAGSLLRATLWPVTLTSDLLDWVRELRVRRAARREEEGE